MRVIDWSRWQRTKSFVAFGLLLGAIGSAGGLEDASGIEPMPSPAGFITCIALLIWLTINIIKRDTSRSHLHNYNRRDISK